MPGLSGIEVLKGAASEGLSTKIVLLTGSNSDESILAAVTGGASGILLKDAAPEDFVDCLERVAKKERCFDPRLLVPR